MRKILLTVTILAFFVCPVMAQSYRQYQITFVDEFGDAVTNITSITIFNAGLSTSPTIYSDRGGENTMVNPITTISTNSTFVQSLGQVRWFQRKPSYKITITDGSKSLTIDNLTESDTRFPWFESYIGNFVAEIRFNPRKQRVLVTFIFDDLNNTDYTIMKPVFDSQGEVACLSAVVDFIGEVDKLTEAQLTTIGNAGWEILSHTKTHADLTALNEAQIRAELSDSKDALEGMGFIIKNFVYPFHYHNETVRRLTRDYYRSARGGLQAINLQILKTYELYSLQMDDHTALATYQGYVDTAESEKKWLIFYLHITDSDDATAMNTLIDYIQAKNISIVTVDQALDLIGNVFEVSDNFAVGESGLRITMPDGGTIGQADGPLLTFDDTDNYLSITGCEVGIGFLSIPGAKFQVRGSVLFTFDDGDAHTFIPHSSGNIYLTGDEDIIGTGDIFLRSFSDANSYRTWMIIKGGTGNVGIGTTSPATSAKLEISSTTGALLLPRMTTTQRNALTAVNGMIIYNTTANKIEGYENGSWVDI